MSTYSTARAQIAILLISEDRQWREVLEHALQPLGNLTMIDNEEGGLIAVQKKLEMGEKYEIIIIDVGTVGGRSSSLVRQIREEQHEAKVVVATTAPTWRQAKEFFQVGAIDYVRKSQDEKQVLLTFQEVLRKKLPPWQPNNYMMVSSEQQ